MLHRFAAVGFFDCAYELLMETPMHLLLTTSVGVTSATSLAIALPASVPAASVPAASIAATAAAAAAAAVFAARRTSPPATIASGPAQASCAR